MDLITSGQTRIRNIEFIRAGDIVCSVAAKSAAGIGTLSSAASMSSGTHCVPDKIISPHPEFLSSSRAGGMQYSCTLQIISGNNNALCRREIWGRAIKHTHAEVCSDEGNQLIMIHEDSSLSFYIPLVEDLMADDWQADLYACQHFADRT